MVSWFALHNMTTITWYYNKYCCNNGIWTICSITHLQRGHLLYWFIKRTTQSMQVLLCPHGIIVLVASLSRHIIHSLSRFFSGFGGKGINRYKRSKIWKITSFGKQSSSLLPHLVLHSNKHFIAFLKSLSKSWWVLILQWTFSIYWKV